MKVIPALKATAWIFGGAVVVVLIEVFFRGWDFTKFTVGVFLMVWGAVLAGWAIHGIWRDVYQHYEKKEQ